VITSLYVLLLFESINNHYQPINVPTAGVQAFLMDYTLGERAITTRAQRGLVGANDCMQPEPTD
jgi:hypothetical protein